MLGFSFDEQALLWFRDGAVDSRLAIADRTESDVGRWVDTTLKNAGLKPATTAAMPYVLEPADYGKTTGAAEPIAVLGAWFGAAAVALETIAQKFSHHAVRDVQVRCWPHHFDIAALLALEAGDPETARSIGVGLSPGDESYAEPYIYCTPWPTPSALPQAPAEMTWHTEGFTSLICPASRLSQGADISSIFDRAVACLIDQ